MKLISQISMWKTLKYFISNSWSELVITLKENSQKKSIINET